MLLNFGKTKTMEPKEKAFELAHKYRLLEIRTSENSFMMISMTDAKKCALIVVDEILGDIDDSILHPQNKEAIEYWQQVKQEINNL